MTTNWIDIPDFPIYEISNTQIRNKRTKHIMKSHISSAGYPTVPLYQNGKKKIVKIHIIMAKCFIPNPDNLKVVNHKNGNKTDFTLENLEWVTYKQNSEHAHKNKLCKNPSPSVLFEELDLSGNILNTFTGVKSVSDAVNRCTRTIHTLVKNDGNIYNVNGHLIRYKSIEENTNEIWKNVNTIYKYINKTYQVSNYGNIRNLKTKRIRKPFNSMSYLAVHLRYKDQEIDVNESYTEYIHRLVAKAFLNGDGEVNHINKNRHDNRLENLEYLNRTDHRRKDSGRKVKSIDDKGIEKIYDSIAEAAEDVYMKPANIYKAINKKHKSADKNWEYVI